MMTFPAIPCPKCCFKDCELSSDFIVALGSKTWAYCQQHLGLGLDMWIHGIEFRDASGKRVNRIYEIWASWEVPEMQISLEGP